METWRCRESLVWLLGSLSCSGAGDLTPEDLGRLLPLIGTVFLVVRWCESQSQQAEVLLRDLLRDLLRGVGKLQEIRAVVMFSPLIQSQRQKSLSKQRLLEISQSLETAEEHPEDGFSQLPASLTSARAWLRK